MPLLKMSQKLPEDNMRENNNHQQTLKHTQRSNVKKKTDNK